MASHWEVKRHESQAPTPVAQGSKVDTAIRGGHGDPERRDILLRGPVGGSEGEEAGASGAGLKGRWEKRTINRGWRKKILKKGRRKGGKKDRLKTRGVERELLRNVAL